MDKKVKKGLDIGAIVLACILFLLGAMILSLSVTKKTNGVPRLFGATFLDIQTDSMKGTIDPGDVAVIKKVKSPTDLKEGDVITFWDVMRIEGKDQTVLNTHRISRIVPGGDGTLFFYTTGDNSPDADGDGQPDEDSRGKVFSEIVGRYSFRLPNLGYFIRFLQSGWGFFLVIILPLAAFLAYRIYILVKVVLEMKKEKAVASGEDPETLKRELEELRAKVANLEGGAPPDSGVKSNESDGNQD